MTAADLVRDHHLRPDDLVVHAGGGATDLLADLRRRGCRVLALDPLGRGEGAGIDTLHTTLTVTTARLVRDRYGAAKLVIAAADVSPVAAAAFLAADGAVMFLGDGGRARAA